METETLKSEPTKNTGSLINESKENPYFPFIPRSAMEKITKLSTTTLIKYEQEGIVKPMRRKYGGLEIVTYSMEDLDAIRRLRNMTPNKPNKCDVVIVFNNKGGVGKSSLAKDLVFSSRLLGFKVLAIDLDSQADLTSLLGAEPVLNDVMDPDRESDPSIMNLLRWELADTNDVVYEQKSLEDVVKSVAPGIDLIPSDLDLGEVNYSITSYKERLAPSIINGKPVPGVIGMFAEFIESVKAKYDVIVIDAPPNIEALNVQALYASNRVLLPLEIEAKSLRTMRRNESFFMKLKSVTEAARIDEVGCLWEKILVIPNKFKRENLKMKALSKLNDIYSSDADTGIELSKVVLPLSSIVDKCANGREPLFTAAVKHGKDNKSSAIQAREFVDYLVEITHEILDMESDYSIFNTKANSMMNN